MKFRGMGPTLKYEYSEYSQSAYAEVSYYAKSLDAGTVDVYDNNGIPQGYATATEKFSFIYTQLGFKQFFNGDIDEKRFHPYVGGGLAFLYKTIRTSYHSDAGYNLSDDVYKKWLWGFHFNAGVQYNIKPVILELRGNFDIILKPLVDGNSNILTNLRLVALVPLSH